MMKDVERLILPTRMSDHEILSKTIYLEARGECEEGQEWVGHVIMNRAEKRGLSIAQVCLEPYQFECWNNLKPSDLRIGEPRAYELAQRIARKVMNRSHDPTGGSDHYNNPSKENPAWMKNVEKVREIGSHWFYRS